MPIPTIPLWMQNNAITRGWNNIRDIWRTSKERYNSLSEEEKKEFDAKASEKANQWTEEKVIPTITLLGEMIPETSLAMSGLGGSEAYKKDGVVGALPHMMMPAFSGVAKSSTKTALKTTEKGIDAAGKALKNADNYVTIQNALRTGKLKFGEPTTYTGIHQSKTPLIKAQFPYQRWDVTTHEADPNGFWLTLADEPNTTGTMASRPYASRWSATSQKPLIQTGEVKGLLGKKNNTRNAIVKYGRKHGADAFEFRGIRDNAIPQTDVVMVNGKTNPQYLGGVGQVRYAGPTTGKSTFIKANPDSGLVDLDAVPGYKQLRKDIADQLGLDWKDSKVTDSPKYQQAFNDFIRDWAQNTENTGKTLFGSAKGLLRGDNPLAGQPFIPDFETFVARNQARGFKENTEQLRAWYNSIVDSYPEIKTDNRFIGEMPLPYNVPKTSIKSIQMEEPIMGRGPRRSSTEVPVSPEAWDEMLFEESIAEQGAARRGILGESTVVPKLDTDNYWYVGHQTGSANFPSIQSKGLQTTNGLSGTATWINQDFVNNFMNGDLKKLHLSHEGSDGLVLMRFPKSQFPKGDLDDISFRLMDLGESSNFEVPSKYMTFFKVEQK